MVQYVVGVTVRDCQRGVTHAIFSFLEEFCGRRDFEMRQCVCRSVVSVSQGYGIY